MSKIIENRIELALLADITDGNPNGDPDMDNMPRTDPETGHGLITDVCTKRKVRNWVQAAKAGKPGMGIYVTEGAVLDRFHKEAVDKAKAAGGEGSDIDRARRLMTDAFYDIRAFGAVLVGEHTLGRVTGPVQMAFGRSFDPVCIQQHPITRMAVNKEADAKKEQAFGRRHTVPYGLYRINLFVSPTRAQGPRGTGFTCDDLDVLIEALINMYDLDRASGRASMNIRALVAFEHDSALGCAPAHKLLERLSAHRLAETPRSFSDYDVRLDEADLPSGVTVKKLFW